MATVCASLLKEHLTGRHCQLVAELDTNYAEVIHRALQQKAMILLKIIHEFETSLILRRVP